MIEILILFITLLIGLVSLFERPKEIRNLKDLLQEKKLLLMISLLILFFILSSLVSIIGNNDQQAKIRLSDLKIQEMKKEIHDLSTKTDRNNNLLLLAVNRSFGYRKDHKLTSEEYNSSIKASTEINNIVSKGGVNIGSNVTVTYFPKDVDKEIVEKALRNLGFKVEQGTTLNQFATNSIWYGKNVSVKQIQSVALTLVKAGVQLKQISPLRKNSTKTNVIQVGTESMKEIILRKSITVDDIMKIRSLKI